MEKGGGVKGYIDYASVMGSIDGALEPGGSGIHFD